MKSSWQSRLSDNAGEMPKLRSPPSMPEFRNHVLRYYEQHGRDLAWRKTTDPYAILVSEIMLQQTQVGRVEKKYPGFLATFPDFSSLAKAPLPDLLAGWQGMGYNRRALSLQKTASIVVRDYDGILPTDPAILATFPGIGPATAHSICAFAFNYPSVFIETNIRRVFIHYFFPYCTSVTDAAILPLVKRALYRKDPRTWYNALMDLGTCLKTSEANPNHRSRQYTKQSPFKGSDREIRGRILKHLLAKPDLTFFELLDTCQPEPDRLKRILTSLEKEGFIVVTGSGYSIVTR